MRSVADRNVVMQHISVLGYGYIGARTDRTQQTNIYLGIHCRNAWQHLTLKTLN